MRLTLAVFIAAVIFALAAPFLPTETTPADPLALQRPFAPWSGRAFVSFIYIPYAKADTDESHESTVQLFEDGKPLGPDHMSFSEVATFGGGRFMFWETAAGWSERVVFSSSDGTDPNTNGRTYRVFDPNAVDPYRHPADKIATVK